ncbi:helix-turn-helix domain-containing protein [Rhizobium leguminosarum]|uniref:helix-turn-helix domain-containing protein n=1 Tax=Rhizobium leguminosarum TaxID=384 RepID=UPI00103FEE3A|nr:helix-turn-helix domain-containing protein [Rhizobium leguminosarum]MBY5344363.1 helix-turn-helix domain-containing protein [Rhizobium leguminosarum]MBY5482655.1 helix-turn-helix domain-containing protein [Rhizobium leguminosarum]NKK54197.1 helix-turn-helix domain-containing protein [Rhizobium leguminosarum bv. viciae]NKL39347.1 helix-turn-helix domain-containing protein [Rhizobium leguminosarum bv. viciae]TBY18173.1 helix-turn-helix domain-containing protein [Rhizobium leguminosarum bv. vi
MRVTAEELISPPRGESAVASLNFTTSDAPSPLEAWRSLLVCLFDSLLPGVSPSSPFKANLVVHHFGTFLLCHSVVDGGRYRRTPARLAHDDIDHIVVSCLQRGALTLARPSARKLLPGDVAVLDLSAPVVFGVKAAEAMHLILPRTLLPTTVAPAQPAGGRILAGDAAMGILIRKCMEALCEAAPSLSPGEVLTLGASVPNLLASCLGSIVAITPTEARGNLGRRLRRHIEENLHRKDLSPSTLTRDLGVSRSQLYRQFGTGVGVETYIRRRRLRRCLLVVCDPRHADRRIGDIAFDMGFTDEAHFSRLFRQAFGLSPRAARSAARLGQGPELGKLVPPEGASFAHWVTGLGAG